MFKSIKIKPLILSLIACFLPGIIGSLATASSVNTWYLTLNRPSFTPPGWLFGPVWTALYLMQGVSLYFLTTTKGEPVAKLIATLFFYFQLVLNLLWSIFFFGLKSPILGFIEIGVLVITVIFTIIASYRISKPASLLLLPYLAWISFATFLNYSVYRLNK